MAIVGNILLGTGAAPGMSSIASAYAEIAASSRIPWSSLEYSGNTITGILGSAIGGQGGGGGDTSNCMPKSASADFYSTSNPSGFLTEHQSLAGYVPKSSISAQSAVWNTVSAKVDQSSISSWSSVFVYKSAVSGWSAQIATLSSTLSSLSATVTAMTANKYTLSAGNGISITNDTANKRTIIAAV